MKIHIKNNRWTPGGFPNTPEGEEVFTITRERFDHAIAPFPGLRDNLDVFIDWDIDHFNQSMVDAEVLLTWDLPTKNLSGVAPNLKWIHCIGAGVEHMLPMDWIPEGVTLTNNKGRTCGESRGVRFNGGINVAFTYTGSDHQPA